MAFASERGKLIFRKVERDLMRLLSEPDPEAVHNFRTSSRRLETLLKSLLPACDRNQKKILKLLSRMRRRAGRIRDVDVQLAALRSFKVPQEPRRKTQLMQHLIELRIQHERKLAKLLKKCSIVELRKRLKRGSKTLKCNPSRDALVVARQIVSAVPMAEPITDEMLHRCRLAVKRARYAAEFAPKSAEVTQFIAGLKVLQDALGNWHDWMTLTQSARNQLGEVSQSPLVAVLHNQTRVKFRHAVTALSASRQHYTLHTPLARKLERKNQAHLEPTQAA